MTSEVVYLEQNNDSLDGWPAVESRVIAHLWDVHYSAGDDAEEEQA